MLELGELISVLLCVRIHIYMYEIACPCPCLHSNKLRFILTVKGQKQLGNIRILYQNPKSDTCKLRIFSLRISNFLFISTTDCMNTNLFTQGQTTYKVASSVLRFLNYCVVYKSLNQINRFMHPVGVPLFSTSVNFYSTHPKGLYIRYI